MHVRGGSQWRSQRKHSLGPLRRAHPASGATWNVQVVRGKMTSKCLWHACRALILGIFLMFLGAGMATIGYYANDLSIGQDLRVNSTVRVRNEPRGIHLNNLSYVGPIVMGFGGFIIVAACVMTFEARDSSGKVVPARYKLNTSTISSAARTANTNSTAMSCRHTSGIYSGAKAVASQTTRRDHNSCLFRTQQQNDSAIVPKSPQDRQALTAALIHFSKVHRSPVPVPKSIIQRRLSRSGSVPNLTSCDKIILPINSVSPSKGKRHYSPTRNNDNISSSRSQSKRRYLQPSIVQMHHHARSVDETGIFYLHPYEEYVDGSQGSIVGYKSPMLSKRSDTARRHILSRQKPIVLNDDSSAGKLNGCRRRSSTISDTSMASRRKFGRGESSTSRTPSIDSRSIQLESVLTKDMLRHTSRQMVNQLSTPSVENEYRSQLSMCSEPLGSTRILSGQSSIEPCVPEEDSSDEKYQNKENETNEKTDNLLINDKQFQRPNSLVLDTTKQTINSDYQDSYEKKVKTLYRSSSSRTYKRKSKFQALKFDEMYFISQNKDDENYDSIEVIDERRKKMFQRSNTVAEVIKSYGKCEETSKPNESLSQIDNVTVRELEIERKDIPADSTNNDNVNPVIIEDDGIETNN